MKRIEQDCFIPTLNQVGNGVFEGLLMCFSVKDDCGLAVDALRRGSREVVASCPKPAFLPGASEEDLGVH
jgi:hypothetical protein